MIKITPKWLKLVTVIISAVSSPYVMSSANCTLGSTSPPAITATLPLTPANITASPDLPDGTILYTGAFKPTVQPGVFCVNSTEDAYFFNKYLKVLSAPTGLSGWTNNKFTHVYKSGVAGVGIVIWKGSVGITPTPYVVQSYGTGVNNLYSMDTSFSFGLIKIGNIVPGQINGSNFPTVVSAITNKQNVLNLPPDLTLAKINFSGTINVVSKTCTTPDVNVPMGSYSIADYFRQTTGGKTPWVDASIRLTGCPRFYGYYDTGKEISITETGNQTVPAATASTVVVSIQPKTETLDAANGIMALNTADGKQSASGVGIQMGWGLASGTPTAFNLNGMTYTPPNSGASTITIPMAARYIQTNSVVTPGRADGKAVFIINYY
jgi:type 1 fimbria pilin